MNTYRVKFTNIKTGKGFISGYLTARKAKEAVKRWNDVIYIVGVRAEYLGKPKS